MCFSWSPGSGFLEPEDDEDPFNRWLTADLAEHGQIRIRLSKSIGLHCGVLRIVDIEDAAA